MRLTAQGGRVLGQLAIEFQLGEAAPAAEAGCVGLAVRRSSAAWPTRPTSRARSRISRPTPRRMSPGPTCSWMEGTPPNEAVV